MTAQILTQARLKEFLHYDPDTGIFTTIKTRKGSGKMGGAVGSLGVRGYLQCRIDYKNQTMHRLAFLYMEGALPTGQVDHINHDKLDNRWDNLRHATGRDNQRNKPLSKNNTSGYPGVSLVKKTGRWEVNIVTNKERKILGYYDDINEAISVRKAAEERNGYHKNHGNC